MKGINQCYITTRAPWNHVPLSPKLAVIDATRVTVGTIDVGSGQHWGFAAFGAF